MPTKTLIASAKAAHGARRAADYGVRLEGAVGFDLVRAKARADAISTESRRGIEASLRETPRCTVIEGHARFTSRDTVEVEGETLRAPRIFVNVGGRARVPRIGGLADVPYLTNASILALESLPRHLVIVGGGPVGLEFAQMYRRFGSDVTLVEMGRRLLEREDEEVSSGVKAILEREGVQVRTSAECVSLQQDRQGVAVTSSCDSGDETMRGSHVLLAAGRRPNTDDLGLDRAGVNTDARGFVVVDDFLRTNVPGIWALGECNGRGAFTHTAYNDYEIVAANLLDDQPRKLSDRIEAYAVYVDPPLGRVGLSESAARKTGRAHLVSHRPMDRVSRAVEKDETQGFMKAVVDAETKRIVGATLLGTGGDEAIHGILYAMYAGATSTTLSRSVGIHPTVSELLPTLLGELRPLA
jgi:pyruvate/2-oxoglutarate dehydrogenase complex dihydrolipoamide dehydrogenase (E3) component